MVSVHLLPGRLVVILTENVGDEGENIGEIEADCFTKGGKETD